MDAVAERPTGLLSLPDGTLAHILSFVEVRERLSTCSLVCRKFHNSALEATDDICLSSYSDSLLDRIRHHSRHLTSLWVRGYGCQLPPLPVPQLRRLRVGDFSLRLGPTRRHRGDLDACTNLTCLHLYNCRLLGQRPLAALASFTGLQELCVRHLCEANRPTTVLPEGVLASLVHLTHLILGQDVMVEDGLLSLAALSNFQALSVMYHSRMRHPGNSPQWEEVALEGVHQLQHFKQLEVSSKSLLFSLASTPDVGRIRSLQVLKLKECRVDPFVLPGLTQLLTLRLSGVKLQTSAAGAAAAALLSALASLKQLQHLAVMYVAGGSRLTGDGLDWPPPSPAYAAFTASSQLQALELVQQDLPEGVCQHMFAAGQQLPKLERLVIEWSPPDMRSGCQGMLCSEDVACLVSCCPNLRSLDLNVQPDAHLTDLPQLSALTALAVTGTSDVAIKNLARCTGLLKLSLASDSDWGTAIEQQWLLPLTALRQLTKLACSPCDPPFGENFGFDFDPEEDIGPLPSYGIHLDISNKV